MTFDGHNLVELIKLFEEKKYEYNDLKDGSGVIISIETGKIITLNGLGNQLISELVSNSGKDNVQEGVNENLLAIKERIATDESSKHSVPMDTVKSDIDSFLSKLAETISQH